MTNEIGYTFTAFFFQTSTSFLLLLLYSLLLQLYTGGGYLFRPSFGSRHLHIEVRSDSQQSAALQMCTVL